MNKVSRWVFRYVGYKTFDFSSKNKGKKRPNLAQNWRFWSFWARPCRLIQCPVGGLVGGCGARAVSRKTPIYFRIVDGNCSASGNMFLVSSLEGKIVEKVIQQKDFLVYCCQSNLQ